MPFCKRPEAFLQYIGTKYPDADFRYPTEIQTSIRFPDRLVVNLYTTTGRVNFQGNSYGNAIKADLELVLDRINN